MTKKKKEDSQETKQTTNELPVTSPGGAGMEVLGPEDIIIPRLTLVQPTSQIEGIEAGKFYMNLTGEELSEVEVVFLKVTKGRVYFADANERKPACGSSDRIKPSLRFDQPVAPTCAECAYSHWNGKEPSLCNETYSLLGVMADTQLPFWWSPKSTAISPTKRFLSGIALRSRMGKNLYDAKVTLRSQLVAVPGKKYFVPVYAATWLADSSPYRTLYEQYAREEIERTFQAEDTAHGSGKDHHRFDWQSGEQAG